MQEFRIVRQSKALLQRAILHDPRSWTFPDRQIRAIGRGNGAKTGADPVCQVGRRIRADTETDDQGVLGSNFALLQRRSASSTSPRMACTQKAGSELTIAGGIS